MQIEYSKRFIKDFNKCPKNIKDYFKIRLSIFIDNQFNPILNNHALSGKLKNFRSININSDWRAIFEELENKNIIYFVAIGTHSQLYS